MLAQTGMNLGPNLMKFCKLMLHIKRDSSTTGTRSPSGRRKINLGTDRIIKIGILQQNSFDNVDTYCSPEKQLKLVRLMIKFYKESQKALREGIPLADIRAMPIITTLLKAKFEIPDDQVSKAR